MAALTGFRGLGQIAQTADGSADTRERSRLDCACSCVAGGSSEFAPGPDLVPGAVDQGRHWALGACSLWRAGATFICFPRLVLSHLGLPIPSATSVGRRHASSRPYFRQFRSAHWCHAQRRGPCTGYPRRGAAGVSGCRRESVRVPDRASTVVIIEIDEDIFAIVP